MQFYTILYNFNDMQNYSEIIHIVDKLEMKNWGNLKIPNLRIPSNWRNPTVIKKYFVGKVQPEYTGAEWLLEVL